MAFRLSMSPMHGISSQMFDEFFFFISGSAAVGVSPLECASMENGSVGHAGCCVSWGRVLAVSLVPGLVPSLLVPGLVPGLVSSVVANLVPLRHASNLCGTFNLCSLLSAVSLGPPEGATTRYLGFHD